MIESCCSVGKNSQHPFWFVVIGKSNTNNQKWRHCPSPELLSLSLQPKKKGGTKKKSFPHRSPNGCLWLIGSSQLLLLLAHLFAASTFDTDQTTHCEALPRWGRVIEFCAPLSGVQFRAVGRVIFSVKAPKVDDNRCMMAVIVHRSNRVLTILNKGLLSIIRFLPSRNVRKRRRTWRCVCKILIFERWLRLHSNCKNKKALVVLSERTASEQLSQQKSPQKTC